MRPLPGCEPGMGRAQVAWCGFQDEGEALVMLQAGALGAYSPAGELQTVPLPAGFTAMWALPQGLLLTVRRCPASAPCGACARPWCLPALRNPSSGVMPCTGTPRAGKPPLRSMAGRFAPGQSGLRARLKPCITRVHVRQCHRCKRASVCRSRAPSGRRGRAAERAPAPAGGAAGGRGRGRRLAGRGRGLGLARAALPRHLQRGARRARPPCRRSPPAPRELGAAQRMQPDSVHAPERWFGAVLWSFRCLCSCQRF